MSRLADLLSLESRPTSPARLGRIALAAVFAGVVGILFLAPLIVRYQYVALSPGDPVIVTAPGAGQGWTVEETDGDTVTVKGDDGRVQTFPASMVVEQ